MNQNNPAPLLRRWSVESLTLWVNIYEDYAPETFAPGCLLHLTESHARAAADDEARGRRYIDTARLEALIEFTFDPSDEENNTIHVSDRHPLDEERFTYGHPAADYHDDDDPAADDPAADDLAADDIFLTTDSAQ